MGMKAEHKWPWWSFPQNYGGYCCSFFPTLHRRRQCQFRGIPFSRGARMLHLHLNCNLLGTPTGATLGYDLLRSHWQPKNHSEVTRCGQWLSITPRSLHSRQRCCCLAHIHPNFAHQQRWHDLPPRAHPNATPTEKLWWCLQVGSPSTPKSGLPPAMPTPNDFMPPPKLPSSLANTLLFLKNPSAASIHSRRPELPGDMHAPTMPTSLQTSMVPNMTCSPSKKLSPMMITVAPPVVHPSLGLMALIQGVAAFQHTWKRKEVRC